MVATAIIAGDVVLVPGIPQPVEVDRTGTFVDYGNRQRVALHGRTLPGGVLVTVHADLDQDIELAK